MSRKTKNPDPTTLDASLPPPSNEQNQAALRRYVENFYDIQELRLQTAGRTYTRPGGVKIELHAADIARLKQQAGSLHGAEKIALGDVQMALNRIPFYRDVLAKQPDEWRGLGPTMWGVILSSFDIAREDTVSKMWSFCGLRPMPCVRCKKCQSVVASLDGENARLAANWSAPHPRTDEINKKCQVVTLGPADVFYSAQAQRPTRGQKLNFNKWLRTKLVGVAGPVILQAVTYRCPGCKERMKKHPDVEEVFIHADTPPRPEWTSDETPRSPNAQKCGRWTVAKDDILKEESPLARPYREYRHRVESSGWGRNDAHRHQASIRYMVKMMLLKLHSAWRTFEGLPVRPSYHEEKLGHRHGGPVNARERPSAPEVAEDQHLDVLIAEEARLAEEAAGI